MAIVQETVVELARFAFETDENRYSDPFAAAGVSLAETAIAIRDHGREVVGKSVAALSEQGLLSLDCSLGGLSLLLATTDGAIAQFEVADLKSEVSQDSNGAFYCSGKVGSNQTIFSYSLSDLNVGSWLTCNVTFVFVDWRLLHHEPNIQFRGT